MYVVKIKAQNSDQSQSLKLRALPAYAMPSTYTSAITAHGKKEHKNADWYEAHWEEMEPVTEEKRKALLAYKAEPGPSTLAALRAARKKSQQTARHCADTYWPNLCNNIQRAADFGDARGMYAGINKATVTTSSKLAPLKSKSADLPIPSQTKANRALGRTLPRAVCHPECRNGNCPRRHPSFACHGRA